MNESSIYSAEDKDLIKQLLDQGLCPKVLIEKFETNVYDFANSFLDIDFRVSRRLFNLRLSRGTFALNEDSV